MRLLRLKAKMPSIQKVYRFAFKQIDIVVMLYCLVCLIESTLYFHEFHFSPKENKWWEWPLYNGWDVEGKIPKYGDYLNSSVSFRLEQEQKDLKEFVRFPTSSSIPNKEEKIILFSFPPFKEEIPYPIDEKKCGGKCVVTYNTSLYDMADAVLFHFTDPEPMKSRRFPSQLYIWNNLESPSSTVLAKLILGKMDFLNESKNVFNMTMTYRRDSDVYFPYFTLHEIREEIRKIKELEDLKLMMATKDRLSAWASGNCGYTKGGGTRTKLMFELLIAGLDVDMFGGCVGNTLPGTWKDLPEQLRRYKFYFSFENSFHCRDYITEKTWRNALLAGAVPVIWGPLRKDVEAVLPVDSFIFVEDFATPKLLVDFIRNLDSNPTAYEQYFTWRSRPLPERIRGRKGGSASWMTSDVVGFCQLCHILYDDERFEKRYKVRTKRVVESLPAWWYGEETKTCLTPRSYEETGRIFWYNRRLNQEYYYKNVTYMRYYVTVYCLVIMILLVRRSDFVKRRF